MGNTWHLEFKQTIGEEELNKWHQLIREIEDITPTDKADVVS